MTKNVIQHTKNFLVMDNNVIQGRELGLIAKGILIYALSKPYCWEFSVEEFMKELKIGKYILRSAIAELEEKKYLIKKRRKNNNGRFDKLIYDFYEIPYDQYENKPYTPINPDQSNIKIEIPREDIIHPWKESTGGQNPHVEKINEWTKQPLINTDNILINTNKKKKDVYKYTSKKEEKTEPKAPSPRATELLAEFEKSLKENLPEIKSKRPTQGACYLDQLLKNYSFDEIKAVIQFAHADEFWKLHVHTPSYLKAKFDKLLVALRRPPKPKISFDKPKIDRTQTWWDDHPPTCNLEQCATDEEKIALGLIPSHLKEKYAKLKGTQV